MIVLGLDSATLLASLAIVDGDRILAELRHDTSGRTADLLIGIDAVCRTAGVTPRQLDAIAVGAGPGSFTGLRIGMATAKGIAFAAGRPLWAVSSLAALAFERPPSPGGVVVGALDARKGEVYAGRYDEHMTLLGDERVMPPDALAPWVAELGAPATSFVGDALAAHPVALAALADRWHAATPSGVAVARLALAGARVDVRVVGAPAYIRRSEAEVMYPDGVPGALRRP